MQNTRCVTKACCRRIMLSSLKLRRSRRNVPLIRQRFQVSKKHHQKGQQQVLPEMHWLGGRWQQLYKDVLAELYVFRGTAKVGTSQHAIHGQHITVPWQADSQRHIQLVWTCKWWLQYNITGVIYWEYWDLFSTQSICSFLLDSIFLMMQWKWRNVCS